MSNNIKSFSDLQRSDPSFTDELTLGKKMQATKMEKGTVGKRKGMKKSTGGVKKNQYGRNEAVEAYRSILMGNSQSKLKSEPDSRPRGAQAILGRKLLQTI